MKVALEEWLGVEARVEPSAIRAGRTGTLGVILRIPEGGHVETHEPAEPFRQSIAQGAIRCLPHPDEVPLAEMFDFDGDVSHEGERRIKRCR